MILFNSSNVSKGLIISSASLFLLGILPNDSHSKDINARSCSFADVQSAINIAVSGDIIVLPAGSDSWSGSLKITKTNLTLQGNGIGSTIITGGRKSITVSGESANNLRVTGIEFRAGTQLIYAAGSGTPRQTVKNLRVDHCKFLRTNVAIETTGGSTGVFDHCEFVDTYGARLYGSNDPNTNPPYKLGTSDALFFEDNTITATSQGSPRHFIASNSHSKYVVRNNTFDYQKSLWDIIDAHGACEVKGRGSATWEIYNNTITLVPSISRVIHLRGGQGVVFNNTFIGDYTPGRPITITDYAVCNGPCTESCTNYPCPDMINHAYFWNNKIRTSPVDPVNNCSNYIKLNRDYFLSPMPEYKPYTYPHPLTESTQNTVSVEKQLSKATANHDHFSITLNASTKSTLIEYCLDQGALVNIAIYNTNGTLIKSLVNRTQPAGSHSIIWDAANSARGLYILKTSIGDIHKNYKLTR